MITNRNSDLRRCFPLYDMSASRHTFRPASISYTNYFGGGWANKYNDRDFAAASVSYSF